MSQIEVWLVRSLLKAPISYLKGLLPPCSSVTLPCSCLMPLSLCNILYPHFFC